MYKWIHLIAMIATVSSNFAWGDSKFANTTDEVVSKALLYIEKNQFQQPTGYYQAGEWSAQMKTYLIPALVGLGRMWGRPSEEPSAFVTSSMVNLLSEVYSLGYRSDQIPNMIKRAIPSYERYREGDIFHYYPVTEFKGLKMHLPPDPHYVPRAMMSMASIPPDADTTSVSFVALAHANLIINGIPFSKDSVPKGTLEQLNAWRDFDRTPHVYNRMFGVDETGAYMTWLWDEDANSSGFWSSMRHKPSRGYRIVHGKNDVDCVVNANVLRMFALTQNLDQPGYQSACKYLNESITKTVSFDTMAKFCGAYYPNTYGAIFSISTAYKAGATCLSDSRDYALSLLISRQREDGSWINDEHIGREDLVQSTASALGSILNYIDTNERKYDASIQRAVTYLISRSLKQGTDQVYWKGEVFFSGGPGGRNTILWRSNAYTTALSTYAIAKANAHLKGAK